MHIMWTFVDYKISVVGGRWKTIDVNLSGQIDTIMFKPQRILNFLPLHSNFKFKIYFNLKYMLELLFLFCNEITLTLKSLSIVFRKLSIARCNLVYKPVTTRKANIFQNLHNFQYIWEFAKPLQNWHIVVTLNCLSPPWDWCDFSIPHCAYLSLHQ